MPGGNCPPSMPPQLRHCYTLNLWLQPYGWTVSRWTIATPTKVDKCIGYTPDGFADTVKRQFAVALTRNARRTRRRWTGSSKMADVNVDVVSDVSQLTTDVENSTRHARSFVLPVSAQRASTCHFATQCQFVSCNNNNNNNNNDDNHHYHLFRLSVALFVLMNH